MSNVDRDFQMVNRPDHWPCWPVLPLTNRHKADLLGFLVAGRPQTKVYLGNIFNLDISAGTLMETLVNYKSQDYADVVTMLKDWKVA